MATKKKAKSKVEMVERQMYRVTLPPNFSGPHRQRAGVFVAPGPDGYVGTLTDEQVEAVKADPVLTLRDYKG